MIHTWERLRGFIVKAGTILFLACIVLWFLSSYGFGEEGFGLVDAPDSIMAVIGNAIRWIFFLLDLAAKMVDGRQLLQALPDSVQKKQLSELWEFLQM